MAKSKLEKELENLTKEQLIEQITDLYNSFKVVQEYYSIFLNPASGTKIQVEYKKIIIKEFNHEKGSSKLRFSVAKQAIADFNKLISSPELVADLMLTLAERACKCGNAYCSSENYELINSQYIRSTYINFDLALKYIKKENLLQDFKQRIEKLLVDNENSGYCMFHDMPKLFDNYFGIGGNDN